MAKNLLSELERQGYKGRVVSIRRLQDLQQEIEHHHSLGFFCQEFYKERLKWFKFRPPHSLADAQSLIVVAFPQPQLRVSFHSKGKRYSLLIPPTYLHYPDRFIEKVLRKFLEPLGYRLAKTEVPLKLLAVRTGLGLYGRNNICYVPGLGSFHRLMAFYSDFPGSDDAWEALKMMEACKKCQACLRSCPTGAITQGRFLLRAELCLTYLNEKKGDFPSWVDPSWHHCLVGCMSCQQFCPQNKGFIDWAEEKEEFTEKETELILNGTGLNELPAQTLKKLDQLDIVEYYDFLPRNLRVLF